MSEMPELELAYRQYQDDAEVFGIDVPLLGADRDVDLRNTRRKEYTDPDGNKYSLTFPLAIDDNNMPYHFAMTAIPVSVVIDRYGVVALIHTGSMDKTQFAALFEKYTSDNYEQEGGSGGGGSTTPGTGPEWTKPDVSQPASSEIQAAINGDNFNGTWHPNTQTGDAEYSWPWLVGETNGQKYIYPANHEVNYSFATIQTEVTITNDDVTNNGKVVLVFDLQWSCENMYDYFYVIINDALIYSYTGTEQWGTWHECYALVADEAGEYTLSLLYVKDEQASEGADTVRIKNVRMISVSEITAESLDMPREAARGWNGTEFSSYINVVLGSDGFYHKDSETGPYVLADLMNTTAFNNRLPTTWSVSEFAVNDYFNYNNVDIDDPKYDPAKDETYAISLWAMAANNSELYGLTPVNAELVKLLNNFIKTQVDNFHNNMWLEFCKYFDHYGTNPDDTGINTPERNPTRGLTNITAFPTVAAHDGAFEDLKNIDDQYKNQVVQTRLIVPRGIKYLFVPEKDGVYRFRSQSAELGDTMAGLYDFDDNLLVTSDSQLENPDENFNFVLTYYLKAGERYILATCYADIAGTGEYTFTTEYLGESYYVWQFAASNLFTTTDEDMTQIINILHVMPVLHTDGKYYNAKKDANGNYIVENGKYVANLNDPIYVDFLSGVRFFDNGSLELCFTYSDENKIRDTVNGVLSVVFGVPKQNWRTTQLLTQIKGGALAEEDWENILLKLYSIYGDSIDYTDDLLFSKLTSCMTVGNMVETLQQYCLSFFDMRYIRFTENTNIPESRYKDYTSLVYGYYLQALANTGNPERGYADRGCVQLTEELRDALDMFCKRIGGFAELDTDWLRLCAHYEYMGPID